MNESKRIHHNVLLLLFQEKHDKINRSQEALIQNLEFKILDLEKRLLGLQQKSVEEDPAYKQKYIDTKRALEYLRSDFNRLEKDLANSKEEVIDYMNKKDFVSYANLGFNQSSGSTVYIASIVLSV